MDRAYCLANPTKGIIDFLNLANPICCGSSFSLPAFDILRIFRRRKIPDYVIYVMVIIVADWNRGVAISIPSRNVGLDYRHRPENSIKYEYICHELNRCAERALFSRAVCAFIRRTILPF